MLPACWGCWQGHEKTHSPRRSGCVFSSRLLARATCPGTQTQDLLCSAVLALRPVLGSHSDRHMFHGEKFRPLHNGEGEREHRKKEGRGRRADQKAKAVKKKKKRFFPIPELFRSRKHCADLEFTAQSFRWLSSLQSKEGS